MSKVYYLGYYDIAENKAENRNYFLSATNKMTYIISAICSLGYEVEVVSASQTRNNRSYDGHVVPLGENSSLRLFKTKSWGGFFKKAISVLYTKHQYYNYLLKTVKKDDLVLVYHSLPYAKFLKRLKNKTGCRLVLEVEEIYSDVNGKKCDYKKEKKAFLSADAFVFSTELLNEKLNTEDKPHTVIYGTYKVEPQIQNKTDDGKVHIVYAGTLDPRKGGAVAAVAAAEFLDENYHIHILGFGSQQNKDQLQNEIERVSKLSGCKVTYDGLLSGDEYIRFLQSCHIGLSTQNPTAAFNDTSFPSKILSYMSNGLRVVSIRIPVIENAAIDQFMHYYDEQNAFKISEAIKKIDITEHYNSRDIIFQLDQKFNSEFKKILGE